MAILKVARLGHPVLREVAKPVDPRAIGTPQVQRFIDDMIETMREYAGAGLAPNQAHTLHQIAATEVLATPRYPDAPSVPLMVVINPVVTPLTDEMEEGWEGCLSVPDMRGMVPRSPARRPRTRRRRGGRAAPRSPTCAAWCPATRPCASRAWTARGSRSTWSPRTSSRASASTRPTT